VLDVKNGAAAAAFARSFAPGMALGEALPISERLALGHRGGVVPGVVDPAGARLIGKGAGPDQVPLAQFGRIDTHLVRRLVDEAFDNVDGLGAAGAAIGYGRRGVGEHETARHRNGGDVVGIGGELQRQEDRYASRAFDIGADVVQAGPAQCQESAVDVEGKLGTDTLVARLIVAEQCFGARRDPFDGTADAASGPDDDCFFWIDAALHAKAAADIARDDADAALRDMQDLMRQDLAGAVHVLRAGVERVAAGGPGLFGGGAPRAPPGRGGGGLVGG